MVLIHLFLSAIFASAPIAEAETPPNAHGTSQDWKHAYDLPASHRVVYLRWEQRNSRLVVGTLDGMLTTWDVRNRRLTKSVVMGREIRSYIPSTNGRMFTLHADGTVALRREQTGEILRSFEFGDDGRYGKRRVDGVRPMAYGGCLVVIYDGRKGDIGEYEFVQLDPDKGRSMGRWTSAPVLCPRAEHLAMWAGENRISLLDAKTKKQLRTINLSVPSGNFALSDDCSKFAIYRSPIDGGEVDIISGTSGRVISQVRRIAKGVLNVVFSHSGKYLLVLSERAYLHRVADGNERTFFGVFNAGAAAFSSDDKYVAIGHYAPSSSDVAVRVFRVPER